MIKTNNEFHTFEEKWQEGMLDWEGKMPERMKSDECEEAFWSKYVFGKDPLIAPSPYARTIMGEVKTLITKEDHIVEIGPGTGNYTFSLAELGSKVKAIDSSSSIIQYLENVAKVNGVNNISFIEDKWEHMQHNKKVDVVFGFNCFYRMYEIKKALLNINNTAKRQAIIGMTTGPIQPHYLKLEQEYGYEIKHPRRDYIDLVNILFEMGIYSNCKLIPLQKVYQYSSYEELVLAQTKKLLTAKYNVKDIEEALASFITYENSQYVYKHDFHAAIITWTPNHK